MASPELLAIIENLAATAQTPDERLALARAYLAADDLPAAAAVAATLPEEPQALYLLGQIKGLLGDTEATITAWKQTLHHDPRHRKAILGLASLQADAGDTDGAITTYANGLHQYPADPYLLFRLHALAPGHAWLMVARGDSRALEGDAEGALEYYQHAAAMAADDARILLRIAWAARRSGHHQLALEACQRQPSLIQELYNTGRRIWEG